MSILLCWHHNLHVQILSEKYKRTKVALQNALLNNSGTLLRFLELTVAVCKLPDGYYNLFDPHARNQKGFVDGNGSAVIMSFPTVDS